MIITGNRFQKIIADVIWILLSALFVLFYYRNNQNGMFFVEVTLLVTEVVWLFNRIEKNITYILFLLSFFIFVMGRLFTDILTYSDFSVSFSDSIVTHILLCIFFAQFFLHFGYSFGEGLAIQEIIYDRRGYSYNVDLVRVNSKTLFFASSVFAVLEQFEIIRFVSSSSYTDFFLGYTSSLPRIIVIFSHMNITFFLLYLASLPQKNDCKIPILVFFFISLLILVGGDRGGFVMNVCVVIVYIFWRQMATGEIWLSRKMIAIGTASVPVIMAGLSYFVKYRDGVLLGDFSILPQVQRFLNVAGNSGVNIIGYGLKYKNEFQQSYYSIGDLLDYIIYNPLVSFITGNKKPPYQTAEYATQMHSYANAISYIIMPVSYEKGHGAGSCYLAELFHDFGYTGIAIFNFILGFLINSFSINKKRSVFRMAVIMIIIRGLFYIPRGATLTPILNVLNLTTIFAFFLIWTLSSMRYKITIRL